MRTDLPLAGAAILAALLLVTPAMAHVSGGIVDLADDLTRGTFRPFGPDFAGGGDLGLGGGGVGGMSGESEGSYVPGSGYLPDAWSMDRRGDVGTVTIDYVFDPALGAMKRLKAFDTYGAAPGYRLSVGDTELRPVEPREGVDHDWTFRGSFDVQFRRGQWIPIFAPGPDAVVRAYDTDPPLPDGVAFRKDGADTFYASAGDHSGRVRLNVTYAAPSTYFAGPMYRNHAFADYPEDVRPDVPEEVKERARLVLDRAGITGEGDRQASRGDFSVVEPYGDVGSVVGVAHRLQEYFLGFGEGDIPGPGTYPDTYLALALGENGCCRHRAFAFALTMQALGAPTRVVVNEAHAFAEVQLPDGQWWQVNLGGCGSYRVNNPDDNPALGNLGDLSRYDGSRNRQPDPETASRTAVVITDFTDPLVKGEDAIVRGFARAPATPPQEGLRVDVHLNTTSEARGRVVGTALTDAEGQFAVRVRLPDEVRPGPHVLVATSLERQVGRTLWQAGWSEPESVRVTSPTRLTLDAPDIEGQGTPFVVRATLTDAAGHALGGERVDLLMDGTRIAQATTTSTGEAMLNVKLDALGPQTLVASYAGSPFLWDAEAEAGVRVGPVGVSVVPEFTSVRGEAAVVDGTLLRDGSPWPDADVQVTVTGPPPDAEDPEDADPVALHDGFARTNANGAFTVRLADGATYHAGTHTVTFAVPDTSYAKDVPLRVRAPTTLALTAGTAYTEAGWTVTACLADDAAVPLSGFEVATRFEGAGVDAWRTNLTGPDGCAGTTLPAGAFPAGALTATAHFNVTDAYAPASRAVSTDAIAGAPPTPLVPAWAWPVIGSVGVLAAAGGTVALARNGVTPGGVARGAALALRVKRNARVDLGFPGIDPDLPPVWAAGAPVLARATVTEAVGRNGTATWRPVAGARVAITVGDAAPVTAVTDADGAATARVTLPADGRVRVTARARASWRRVAATDVVDVRAVDYREEAERVYRALVADAIAAGAPVTPASTPRDVERALAAWAPRAAARDLADVAALFEALAFSERDVTRADYVRVARAAGRVRDAFPRALGEVVVAA